MAELKTKANKASVLKFIKSIGDENKQKDSLELLKIFKKVTGQKAVMWGTSIVGFGKYHYESERSNQKGDWPLAGFSPRKQNMTIYFVTGFDKHKDLINKLGKHKTSVGCLYFNKLSDLDVNVLKKLLKNSYLDAKKRYKA